VCSEATVLTKAALSAKMQLAFCFHCTLSKQQKKKIHFVITKTKLVRERKGKESESKIRKVGVSLSSFTTQLKAERYHYFCLQNIYKLAKGK